MNDALMMGLSMIPVPGVGGAEVAETQAVAAMDPWLIRFSQSSCSWTLHGGETIGEWVEALQTGAKSASDLDPIRIFQKDGNLFTLDNRRLEVFRRAGMNIRYRWATAEEVAREFKRKMSTLNGGTTIRVRGEPVN